MKKTKKMTVIHLKATTKVSEPVSVEVIVNDPKYDTNLLIEDIHFKRVWFEQPPDKDGWLKLVYSSDGPTGDPWQIGKIKFHLEHTRLDLCFGDFSELKVVEP